MPDITITFTRVLQHTFNVSIDQDTLREAITEHAPDLAGQPLADVLDDLITWNQEAWANILAAVAPDAEATAERTELDSTHVSDNASSVETCDEGLLLGQHDHCFDCGKCEHCKECDECECDGSCVDDDEESDDDDSDDE